MSLAKKISGAKYKVSFTFDSNFAKKVQLLGDFNAWDASTAPMKAANGKFSIDIELPANSSFQFRYLIDEQAWDNDSNADYYVDSPFSGIQNSVVVLDAIAESTKPSNTAKTPVKKVVAAPKAVKTTKEAKIEKTVTLQQAPAKKVATKAVVSPKKKVEAPANQISTKAVVSPKKKVEAAIKKVVAKAVVSPKKNIVAPAKADNLTIIEGIGPKIAEILVKGGISTFTKLSKSKAADVKKLLDAAGSKFAMHDPATWGAQAALAASGDMIGLNKMKDELNGGKKK